AYCTSASCARSTTTSASKPSRTSFRSVRRSRSRSARSTPAASCRSLRGPMTTTRRKARPRATEPVTTVPLAPDQAHGTTRTLLSAEEGGLVRRTVLPGGLRVVTEAMPGVRSATIGIWVGVGSRDEPPELAGASHFLEHLLFKGTPNRSAVEISAALESVGGEMNAFTSRELTCFHARVIDSDLSLAIDVLCDMVTSSALSSDDVDVERGV